jgi:serpin B
MNKAVSWFPALSTVAILCIFFAGCTGAAPRQPASQMVQPVITATGNMEDARLVADANNRFAFDLYSKLSKNHQNAGNNIFFSPFSLSSVFALTYEGARDTTADEIRSVFHFPADNMTLREGYAGLNAGMNGGNVAYTLSTANAFWAQKAYPFHPEYISTATRYYGVNTTNLDFSGNPEGSRATINRWVEEKTDDKIRELLPAGSIDGATRLVITNAIYFNGKWEQPFAVADTRDLPFFLDELINSSTSEIGPTVTVPTMQREDTYPYTETRALRMIELPYKAGDGSDLSMLVILPQQYGLTALAEVENSLNPAVISGLERDLTDEKVAVFLPKFRLETEYRLPDTLKGMGMRTAFTGSADFSGIDGTRSLFISDVIQKAFIDVTEEGTEAAASSAVIITQGGSSGKPCFVADHPFLFVITERENGTILFMGRVTNPAVM